MCNGKCEGTCEYAPGKADCKGECHGTCDVEVSPPACTGKLDCEAAAVCREMGLPMVRSETVNDDPLFLDMMADVVANVWNRHRSGRPLPIVC